MTELLWWVFASLAVAGGLGMVSQKNPVASLLFLVLSFFGLAALYVLLGAHFIAAIQVLVYAGAIMVLFLFVIMLLNLGHEQQPDVRGAGWKVAGSADAAAVGGAVAYVMWRGFAERPELLDPAAGEAIDAAVREFGAVGAIAFPLFREYVVPFELTSILLLTAIIGAVLLAKRRV